MSFQEYILRWHRLRSPFGTDGTGTIRRHLVPAFGPLSLREVDVTRVNEFRRRLVAAGLSGKSITNLIGTLHKAMADAVEEGLIATNPVLRIRSGRRRRAGARVRQQSDPLTTPEIAQFLATVPVFYRPLYDVWFRLGWRSSEIVALRFRNVDFGRRVIRVDTGRMPRFGGIEAEPKTGPREVDCSYDPTIFARLDSIRKPRRLPRRTTMCLPTPTGSHYRRSGSTSACGSLLCGEPASAPGVSTACATASSRSRCQLARILAGSPRCAGRPRR